VLIHPQQNNIRNGLNLNMLSACEVSFRYEEVVGLKHMLGVGAMDADRDICYHVLGMFSNM
jgi:hypothetical protein